MSDTAVVSVVFLLSELLKLVVAFVGCCVVVLLNYGAVDLRVLREQLDRVGLEPEMKANDMPMMRAIAVNTMADLLR